MNDKKIKNYLLKIEKKLRNPSKELGEHLFKFVTRLTPIVNVDLLIRNKKKQILLTWRKSSTHYNAGWHVPGGIIRLGERLENRVFKVAKKELNTEITFRTKPVMIHQMLLKQKNRSHFISFVYECSLLKELDAKKKFNSKYPKYGHWKWFKKCPKNLILPHKLAFEKFFNF